MLRVLEVWREFVGGLRGHQKIQWGHSGMEIFHVGLPDITCVHELTLAVVLLKWRTVARLVHGVFFKKMTYKNI